MKPKSQKNKVRDARDNLTGRRGYERRKEVGDVDMGWRYWPVPSWYTRMLNQQERPHEREILHDLKKDPEDEHRSVRKHKRDAGYYW